MNGFLVSLIIGLTGVVNSVHDGDTVTVTPIQKNKPPIKVRILQIDAPELKQNYGVDSKAYLETLVLHCPVKLQGNKKDIYGRTLAKIKTDTGKQVSDLMIQSGAAWVYKDDRTNKRLMKLEQKARDGKLGLWKEENPEPPWEFRKHKQEAPKIHEVWLPENVSLEI